MRWMVLVMVAVLLVASAAWAEKPSVLEWSALAVAEASLAVDAMQTLDVKRHPGTIRRNRYSGALEEDNPLLGKHPGDVAIVGYFAGAAVGTAVLWRILPRHLRLLVPFVVLAIEVPTIRHNAASGLTIRF